MKIKKLFVFLCAGILIGIMFVGCSNPAMYSTKKENKNTTVTSDVMMEKSRGGYVRGLPYISDSAIKYVLDGKLQKEYEKWRKEYVVDTPSGNKRVRRDVNGQYDTVSEGMGYGMLLAVYFNDQNTFDKLFRFVQEHYIFYPNYIPLMHWKVDANCDNVSEFADYKIDRSVIFYPGGYITSQTAEIPHGAVFGNLTDGTIFVTSAWAQNDLLNKLDADSNYYRMFKKGDDRQLSCATDADEDIAAALAFASKVWSSSPNGIDYKSEARQMIKAIQKYDFTADGFIKAGNAWGDRTCWNPSYFTPAYYLNVYAAICPEDTAFWQNAYTTMYNEMDKIVNYDLKKSNSGGKIFFPDWCDTSVSGEVSRGKLSDRIYYKDGKQDDGTINDGMKCPLSAMWMKGTSKDQYTAIGMMSFNSYYDAVRVPWRLMTDYLWDSKSIWIGSSSKARSEQMTLFQYQSWSLKWNAGLVDGYTIIGDPWKYEDRDGFNVNTGSSAGGKWPTAEFISMTAPVYLRNGTTPPSTSTEFQSVIDKDCYNPDGTGGNYGYNYYGNTVRLLSLLTLTGKLENLYNAPPNGKLVRIYNKKQSSWFMHIEDKVPHVVECHDGSMNWWSAQWTIQRNNVGYYTFKNKWNNGLGYDPYMHCEDGSSTVDWDKYTEAGAGDNSQWILVQTKDSGYYIFKNRRTGKILSIKNMTPAAKGLSSVKIETFSDEYENEANQWRFEIVQ